MAKALMIQGAGSNVGKSMLVAGLSRALTKRGFSVAPFKPQNMSNNAAVTADGGEIGRAQALQAMACGIEPMIDMNPVLLKPETETGAQIIVQGKRHATLKAADYGKKKAALMPAVLESFHRLSKRHDIIIAEGAGSPAEVNLRKGDIANMGFAAAASVPVVLIGDIDRGGVIAQMVGTHAVLDAADNALIKGFAINKFRGDPTLFIDGMSVIQKQTCWPSMGILPWFQHAWKLPAEDILDISSKKGGITKVAVPRFNRIANFDDLDPLSSSPDISVEIVEPGRPIPGDADLVILPGSKSTISDLAHFRAQGWDIDLHAHIRRGGHVLGICGGYQMLGKEIHDDDGLEGLPGRVTGLGHLDIITKMKPEKRLARSSAVYLATNDTTAGYEIHLGETTGPDCERAWLSIEGRPEGASSKDRKIKGCYLHGLFSSDGFRSAFFESMDIQVDGFAYQVDLEETLDDLAAHIEQHLNVEELLAITRK